MRSFLCFSLIFLSMFGMMTGIGLAENEFADMAVLTPQEIENDEIVAFTGLWDGTGADIQYPYEEFDYDFITTDHPDFLMTEELLDDDGISFSDDYEDYACGDGTIEFNGDEPLELDRLHSNPRLAVVLEAFYSLHPAHHGGSSKAINGWAAGCWNYLETDLNAYTVMKNRYGGYSSNWSSFYSNPWWYGDAYGYGRLGQCKYAANLTVYRSGVKSHTFPTYSACRSDYSSGRRYYTKPTSKARRGDILMTRHGGYHTAVVVAILSGTEGHSVNAVDVVDSNWVQNETVCRHIMNRQGSWGWYSDLDNYLVLNLRDSSW